jgi:hypothetical protein
MHAIRKSLWFVLALSCVLIPQVATADRTISDAVLLDKLRGMWFGQLIANHTGRPLEGSNTTREALPDAAFSWVIKTTQQDPWTGDDDTNFEYLNLHGLETYGVSPTQAQIQAEWNQHVTYTGIYIANLQAKFLMDHGLFAPATGSYRHNMHAYAIDSQITTESLGAMSPGMRQWAVDGVRKFGGVTNSGFSLHAAQYYAAMYAAAAFESDVNELVRLGQETLPHTSRTWRAIQDVREWYTQDMLDSVPDWRETRRLIYDYYVGPLSVGRYRNWIESTVNVACTTLALLYGQGDFEETVRLGVLAGFDNDCNPATAGGLIGMIHGFSGLPTSLTSPATDHYYLLYFQGLTPELTISGISSRMRAAALQVILANGGSDVGGVYHVPDADPVTPEPEMPDPTGPTGLVRDVQASGGSVTTSASVTWHVPEYDRYNLDSIIDGITDTSHNGHVPYMTCTGPNPNPAFGDFYQLSFSESVRFDRLVFHEGDLVWSGINADPQIMQPVGGYFLDLIVEVQTQAGWTAVTNMNLSEPLDPFLYYQVIELTFDATAGNAVRIRGQGGGSSGCTSIVELVAHGSRLGDMDADGVIEIDDISPFIEVLLGLRLAPAEVLAADMNVDGAADGEDIPRFVTTLIQG